MDWPAADLLQSAPDKAALAEVPRAEVYRGAEPRLDVDDARRWRVVVSTALVKL